MIRKSGNRFSEKIMLEQDNARAFNSVESCSGVIDALRWGPKRAVRPRFALPPHALARHDEGRRARGLRAVGEIPVSRDDDNEKREYGEKVDLSGIVTVVADFPAHCLCAPCRRIKSMRL
jgi:hypothetical protein